MKKKIWILVLAALLGVSGFLAYRYDSLPAYETPFQAEEVKSVNFSNHWEYKIIEDQEGIEKLISQLNSIKILSPFDERMEQLEEGNTGYSLCFELVDGRQMEYHAVRTQGFQFLFSVVPGIAYSAKNFVIGKLWNQLDAVRYPSIPANVYRICYQGEVYEGIATVGRVPEKAKLAGTVTGITAYPDEELECSYRKAGQNVYVWEEDGKHKLGVEVNQDVWTDPLAAIIEVPHIRSSANPEGWGVDLTAENVTSSGLQIRCHHSGGEGVFQLHTGSYYALQRSEETGWVDVEPLPQPYEVAWTDEAWNIEKESTTLYDVDWTWLYGQLPAGEYRIGKEIVNFRETGDYDKGMLYAEFTVG